MALEESFGGYYDIPSNVIAKIEKKKIRVRRGVKLLELPNTLLRNAFLVLLQNLSCATALTLSQVFFSSRLLFARSTIVAHCFPSSFSIFLRRSKGRA